MNREIKFRIWDVENKEMLKVQELDFEPTFYGGRIAIRPDQYNDYFDTEDMILMQYTGLHDKNEKEIYEGDIIEFSYDIFTGNFDTKVGIGTIEFLDGAFYIIPFEIEGKRVDDIENEEWFLLYTVNMDTLEVIGNIYDNPELLGGE